MRTMLFGLLLTTGCMGPEAWGRSDITVQGSDEFHANVAHAVDLWNWPLQGRCGFAPFRIVPEGGHPVVEVPRDEWTDPVAVGWFNGEEIAVRAELLEWGPMVTTHELGHALGLDHVSKAEDPDSIMHVVADHRQPSAGDVERAAAELGCD